MWGEAVIIERGLFNQQHVTVFPILTISLTSLSPQFRRFPISSNHASIFCNRVEISKAEKRFLIGRHEMRENNAAGLVYNYGMISDDYKL